MPVFVLPDGLEMFDGEAGADPRQHLGFLVQPILRDDDRDRLADDFLRGVTEHPLGGGVPGGNAPVQILADDGVVRGGHDGGQSGFVLHRGGHQPADSSPFRAAVRISVEPRIERIAARRPPSAARTSMTGWTGTPDVTTWN